MPFVKLNGQEIFFQDTGGNQPALIFMHGFLMNQSMFDPQVDFLSGKYRCIRWDARGFGQTRWDGKSFSLYDSASDCIGLMDELGIDSAIVVGMSQGGYCAIRMALKYPHRVKGLVLMSTRSGVDEEPVKEMYRQTRDTWANFGPVEPLIDGLATALLGPKEVSAIKKHRDHWIPQWKKIPGENIFHAMNNLLDRDDVTSQLGQINCPTLVTHGTDDIGMPMELGKKLSYSILSCKGFVPVAGAAHLANLTHPDLINQKVSEFLAANFRD